MIRQNPSRRDFIKHSALSMAAVGVGTQPFAYIKGSAADQINVAIMGVKSRGKALARAFAHAPDCTVKYICEVDERYVGDALKAVAEFQPEKPKVEKDIRKVLEDKEVDALVVAAPDHWHAPATIMACEAGKHVYVEKPCSHNPQEGEWVVAAAEKYNRVVQMGNQRRTWSNVRKGIEQLHGGIIGHVYYANGWYANKRPSIGKGSEVPVPTELDFRTVAGTCPKACLSRQYTSL